MDLIFANNQDLSDLITILLLNVFVVFFISKFIYLRFNNKGKKSLNEFFFTYNSAGLITFLLCFLLSNVKLDLGFDNRPSISPNPDTTSKNGPQMPNRPREQVMEQSSDIACGVVHLHGKNNGRD